MTGFRFSRRTVLAAVEILERLSQAKLSRFFLEIGPNLPLQIRGESVSATKRLNDLMETVDAFPSHARADGALLRDLIVEKAISLLPPIRELEPWESPPPLYAENNSFQRALELDGYHVTEDGLRSLLPLEYKISEAEDELHALLGKHRLSVAKGHLDQAMDAHTQGNWAAANGQLRTFFDALLDTMAERLDPTAASLPSGQPRRAKLAGLGILHRELNEWDDDGRGYINGLVKRLHPQGAHPGLSDGNDSAFRLHVILLTAHLLLVRFDKLVKP